MLEGIFVGLTQALPFFFLAAIAGLALVMRWYEGDWFTPATFFSSFWALQLVLCLVPSGSQDVPAAGVGWILAAAVSFSAGVAISGYRRSPTQIALHLESAKITLFNVALIVCTLAGVGAVLVMLSWAGRSLADLASTDGIIGTVSDLTVLRYTGDRPPPVASVLLTGIYLGALLGGAISGLGMPVGRIPVLPILVAVLYTVVTSAKAPTLISGILWVSSYMAVRVAVGEALRINWKAIGLAIIFFAVGVMLFGALLALRYGFSWSIPELGTLVRATLTGHVSNFSYWFDESWHSVEPMLGVMTFAGIADFLGVFVREKGLYSESLGIFGHETNIYTMFRVFIDDFGPVWALVVLATVGFVAGLSLRAVRQGYGWALAPAAFIYALILWSPVTALSIYNSILLAAFLFVPFSAAVRVLPPAQKV